MGRSFAPCVLGLAAALAGSVAGQVGWEQQSQVNSYTPGDQTHPTVAVAPDGRFLVVWESAGSPGSDGDGTSVLGRWFEADGSPRGEDVQLNTVTAGDQGTPAVTLTPSGGAIVVWRTPADTPLTGTCSVRAQLFSADGTQVGGEFVVAEHENGQYQGQRCAYSDVAAESGSDGRFIVVWRGRWYDDTVMCQCWPQSCDHTYVAYRVYGADGQPLGNPTVLASGLDTSTMTLDCLDQSRVDSPAVGVLPGGGWVSVFHAWARDFASGQVFQDCIWGRRLDSQGLPAGDHFCVTDGTLDGGVPGSVAPVPDGGFVATWHGGSVPGVSARIFAADATPAGSSFQVAGAGQEPSWPTAHFDPWEPAAGFTVLWSENPWANQWIRGQGLDWQGSLAGSPFRVNPELPSLAANRCDLSGDVAVWASFASAGSDQSGSSIQARRLPPVSLGLVGWWRGEGDAEDSSWHSNDGALAGGAGFAPGVMGSAFALGGVDDWVVVPDSDPLDIGVGDLAITYWVKSSDTWAVILDKRSVSPSAGYLAFLENGCPALRLKDAGGNANFVSATSVADDQFHFVAISVDRDSPTGGRIWVDGVLALEFDPTVRSGSLANTQELRVGAQGEPFGGGANLTGLLDEVRVYNRLLSEQGMLLVYHGGSALVFGDGFASGDALAWSSAAP